MTAREWICDEVDEVVCDEVYVNKKMSRKIDMLKLENEKGGKDTTEDDAPENVAKIKLIC